MKPVLLLIAIPASFSAGCATPQYALRPTPIVDESAAAIQIERTISGYQGREFDKQGARAIGAWETVAGFAVQSIIDRLSRVSERPNLRYRALLYTDNGPNAAALADGRIYISTGLLKYLQGRESQADELAFILGHELGHTVAQHLVKRYQYLQRQQVMLGLLAAGASAITQNAGSGIQQAGRLALDVAQVIQDVSASGYSQDQELEADQLGVRYVIHAGFNPQMGLAMLDDFQRFDSPSPFLRTHPYTAQRRAYLIRYLEESGYLKNTAAATYETQRISGGSSLDARIQELRDAQKSYSPGSLSWQNLQREIDTLKDHEQHSAVSNKQ